MLFFFCCILKDKLQHKALKVVYLWVTTHYNRKISYVNIDLGLAG